MFSYLFGGSQVKTEAPKKAIVKLREHVNLLAKKQSHLYEKVDELDALARKYIATDKPRAKAALKSKKLRLEEANKITSQMEALESQLRSIENANLNLETMNAMKAGAKAMKTIHNGMTVDKVDQTMDEIREQAELGDEISDAISRSYPVDAIDEDELEEELEQLEQEAIDNKLLNSGTTNTAAGVHVDMPSVPSTSLKTDNVQEEEDEDEKALRELQAEMGI